MIKEKIFSSCHIVFFLLLILGCGFLLVKPVTATTYYIDATGGNDLNSGTSTGAAWQTISKVNTTSFNPGDSVLFERGETWLEKLGMISSGTSGNTITFGAYGSGNKPNLYGNSTISTNYGVFNDLIFTGPMSISGNNNVLNRIQLTSPAEINTASPTITTSLESELVQNSDFETSGAGGADVFANWTEAKSGSSTINNDVTDVYSGSHAARLDIDSSNSQANLSQGILTAGNWYQYSVWAKANTGTPYISIGNSSGTVSFSQFQINNTYTQYIGTGRAGGVNFFVYRSEGSNSKSIYFDQVSAKKITWSSMIAYIGNHQQKNGSYSATPTVANGTQAGILINYADDNNFVMVIVDRATNSQTAKAIVLSKIGGVYTQVISGSITYGDGLELKVIDTNGYYTLFYDNVQVGSETAISETALGYDIYGFSSYTNNTVGTVTTDSYTASWTESDVTDTSSFNEIPATSDDFSIIYLPDTQEYSKDATSYFGDQTQWIVDNADALNIKMVLHEGDIVNSGNTDSEWAVATTALNKLNNANISTLLSVGNHDYVGSYTSRVLTNFLSVFPATWYTEKSWFNGGFYNNEHSNVYTLKTIGDTNYIFITLEYNPRAGVLTWLDNLLTTHSDRVAILVTHAFLRGYDQTVQTEGTGLWNIINNHANVLLIGGGHYTTAGVEYYEGSRTNRLGNGSKVLQFMANYQDAPNGGNGYLRIVTVKPNSRVLLMRTYSPTLDSYFTDANSEFVMKWPEGLVSQPSLTINGDDNTASYVLIDNNDTTSYTGTLIAGDNNIIQNFTIAQSADGGIKTQADAAITNSLVASSDDDIEISSDKTVTGIKNLFGSSGKVGDGTYTDTGNFTLWSSDPLFTNPSGNDFSIQTTSAGVDAGVDVGQTNDYSGNFIYGAPDIGAFEYQPTFVVGTDDLDVTGNVRIYGDGKFRYTTTTSGVASAKFQVTPSEGTWWTYGSTEVRPEWLNISDITWNTSEPYSKQWTASSTIATTTIYTIGDFDPSEFYNLTYNKGSGAISMGTYKSNGSGELTFTYTGGYSDVTFNLAGASSPTVSISDVTVNEDAGTATVSVTLSGTLSNDSVTVDYSTSNGTATSVSDYTAVSGTFTWAAGETGTKTFSVTISNDSLDENNETITITLSNPSNATISDSTGTVTITDNDATPTVSWTASSQSVSEANTSITITAEIDAVSALTATIPYTITGTADEDIDYTITASPLIINSGSTTATVTITVIEDSSYELDETIIITISAPTNATAGETAIHTATISNDDASHSNTSGGGSEAIISTTPDITLVNLSNQIGANKTTIQWTTSGSGIDSIGLYYSSNNGASYTQIVYNLNKSLDTFVWNVPNLEIEQASIKIIAYDSGKAVLASDISDVFTITKVLEEIIIPPEEEDDDQGESTETTTDEEGRIVAGFTGEIGFSPVNNQTEQISKVFPGQYLRSYSFNTIYYIDENFIRHPFWDTKTFFTYANSWNEVIWVTDATLPTMTLGLPVLPKPGVVLTKIQSDSKVYAIDFGNVLRWVPNEATALTLYGAVWADYIIDLEPTIFVRFTIGDNMTMIEMVDRNIMKTREKLKELAQ